MDLEDMSDEASEDFASSEEIEFDEFFMNDQQVECHAQNMHDQPAEQSHHRCLNDNLDPYLYVSSRYFSFDRATYKLMEFDLEGRLIISIQEIKDRDARGLLDLKRWRQIRDDICLLASTPTATSTELGIRLKSASHLRVPCIEVWGSILWAAHVSPEGIYLSLQETLDAIKVLWCVDIRKHGIPLSYVKDWVKNCVCVLNQGQN
ncbi:hypothetical protein L7F22_033538 [Adiantum nelumboides]|nr:hypothetical protein [Adiantum nelumboides]